MARRGRPATGLGARCYTVRLADVESDALAHMMDISGLSAASLIRQFVSEGLTQSGALSAPVSLPLTKHPTRKEAS